MYIYEIKNEFEDIPIYMDEKFHLNQTISYYNNNYYLWDNKLTTFPGTFFIGSLEEVLFDLGEDEDFIFVILN